MSRQARSDNMENQFDNMENQFKDLYYHLYSNSNASRSERILSDLSKLILVSIAHDRGDLHSEVALFETANGTANDLLPDALVKQFPNIIHDQETFSLDDDSLRHSFKLIKKSISQIRHPMFSGMHSRHLWDRVFEAIEVSSSHRARLFAQW